MGRSVKGPSKIWVGQQECLEWCIRGQNFVWVGHGRRHGLPGLIARTASEVSKEPLDILVLMATKA